MVTPSAWGGCGAARFGFVRSSECHPYGLPSSKSHLNVGPYATSVAPPTCLGSSTDNILEAQLVV